MIHNQKITLSEKGRGFVLSFLALCVLVFAAAISSSGSAADGANQTPQQSHTPKQVVHAIIAALQDNDTPHDGHGIEVTFAFASPGNKAATGPLSRFAQMVQGPVFGVPIGHRSASFENNQVDGDRAVIDVILFTAAGNFVGYRFHLSKQTSGDCVGCWMTDAVLPFEVTST